MFFACDCQIGSVRILLFTDLVQSLDLVVARHAGVLASLIDGGKLWAHHRAAHRGGRQGRDGRGRGASRSEAAQRGGGRVAQEGADAREAEKGGDLHDGRVMRRGE